MLALVPFSAKCPLFSSKPWSTQAPNSSTGESKKGGLDAGKFSSCLSRPGFGVAAPQPPLSKRNVCACLQENVGGFLFLLDAFHLQAIFKCKQANHSLVGTAFLSFLNLLLLFLGGASLQRKAKDSVGETEGGGHGWGRMHGK